MLKLFCDCVLNVVNFSISALRSKYALLSVAVF